MRRDSHWGRSRISRDSLWGRSDISRHSRWGDSNTLRDNLRGRSNISLFSPRLYTVVSHGFLSPPPPPLLKIIDPGLLLGKQSLRVF